VETLTHKNLQFQVCSPRISSVFFASARFPLPWRRFGTSVARTPSARASPVALAPLSQIDAEPSPADTGDATSQTPTPSFTS
jgi:hypothetical protein